MRGLDHSPEEISQSHPDCVCVWTELENCIGIMFVHKTSKNVVFIYVFICHFICTDHVFLAFRHPYF